MALRCASQVCWIALTGFRCLGQRQSVFVAVVVRTAYFRHPRSCYPFGRVTVSVLLLLGNIAYVVCSAGHGSGTLKHGYDEQAISTPLPGPAAMTITAPSTRNKDMHTKDEDTEVVVMSTVRSRVARSSPSLLIGAAHSAAATPQ
jgi:hypothetical protein